MAFRLSELFVEFTTRGVEAVKTALGDVKGLMEKVRDGAEQFGKVASYSFAAATASLSGFVTAGLAGTTAGERLSLQMTLLSREIAQLFLPVIERLSNTLATVNEWFRSLSGWQQNLIGTTLTWGIALLGVAAVIPRVVAAIGGLIAAMRTLGIVSVFVKALQGDFASIALAVGATAVAAGGLYALTGSGNKDQGRNQLASSSVGFEAVQDSFRRVQQQALRSDLGGSSVEQQQLDQLKRIGDATEGTAQKVGALKPAVV